MTRMSGREVYAGGWTRGMYSCSATATPAVQRPATPQLRHEMWTGQLQLTCATAAPLVLPSLLCAPAISLPLVLPLLLARLFLRYRMGCHDLPSDAGRRQGVPRLKWVCPQCSLGEVGDERHLVFTCLALEHIRSRFRHLFGPRTFTMVKFYGKNTWFLSLGSSRIVSISCGVPILHLNSPMWLEQI
jgi:hypothetical protein